MTNKIRSDFNSELANSLLNDIQYQLSNYYYSLGKIDKWNTVDSVPALPSTDSNFKNNSVKDNIIFVKKITSNDVSIVIPRYDWISGEQYDFWDDKKDMRELKFYCVNSDLNVYKCLNNNGGAISTVMPEETSLTAFKTTDGYTWKYMYNIPIFKRNKFNTLDYIAVQRALSDSFYNKGSIERVNISAGGSGYGSEILTHLTVTRDPGDSGGGLPNASTAILVPIISLVDVYNENGIITRLKGSIIGVKIISGGGAYLIPPTIDINDTLNLGRGLYTGNTTAKFYAVINQGVLVNVLIADPGYNYSYTTDTSIVVQGDGTGAKFTPVVHEGSVVDVIVENIGIGYTYISLTVEGGGTGAKVNAVFNSSDFLSDQSIIEQNAVSGAIYSIEVENGGKDYSVYTTINVDGDWQENGGTECIATPVIVNGIITKIVITDFGSKYSYIDLKINDTTGSGAILRVIITPAEGHGVDAVSELFGNTIAINSTLRDNKIIDKLSQNYRQFGIIKNPTNKLTGKKFRDEYSLITFEVTFDDVIGLFESGIEDTLLFGDVEFKVVYVKNNVVTLQQIGSKYVNPVGMFKSKNTNKLYTSTQVVSYPSIDKYSGKLLYVSDENRFSLNTNQGLVIKTFLKF